MKEARGRRPEVRGLGRLRSRRSAKAAGADGEADALALAIEADDWERVALLVALGMTMATRLLPEATVDDLLALLSEDEEASQTGAAR